MCSCIQTALSLCCETLAHVYMLRKPFWLSSSVVIGVLNATHHFHTLQLGCANLVHTGIPAGNSEVAVHISALFSDLRNEEDLITMFLCLIDPECFRSPKQAPSLRARLLANNQRSIYAEVLGGMIFAGEIQNTRAPITRIGIY